jgi:hypothetical protein
MLPVGHSTHSRLKFPSDVEGGPSVCMDRLHAIHPSEFSGLMVCCGQLWHLECSVDQKVPVQTHARSKKWYVEKHTCVKKSEREKDEPANVHTHIVPAAHDTQ